MEIVQAETLASIRVVVGYLGEKEQFGWWGSSFLSSASHAFLSPIFGRTELLAQCTGVSRAASIKHDEHIGIGEVYHLFRLPEDLEQGIHNALQRSDLIERVTPLISDRDAALKYLHEGAPTLSEEGIGPIRIGDRYSVRDHTSWQLVKNIYLKGFKTGVEVFPYFSGEVE